MEKTSYNPDVLNCLANLSNDEVFTPPELANRMLDLLPPELFRSRATRFLDPFTKSGVFLREVVKRLDIGLAQEIPDRQERIDHILHHQVFGIAITELTAHLSRRSVYCSRSANSPYSISHFATPEGNIHYAPMPHTWQGGKCRYCGANQSVYDRSEAAEQHAYPFIHTDNPQTLFPNMTFDVIIGNPPYQMSDGSGGSTDAAMPIYNKFVEQAIKLQPHYLVMIIPSKWMVGGRGLQGFRATMVQDRHVKRLMDFEDAKECFGGIHIDGGVCYFLWDKTYDGLVHYTYKANDGSESSSVCSLSNEYFDFVIRDQRILPILEKIGKGASFSDIVSSTKPYGIRKFLFNEPERYPEAHLSDTAFKGSVRIFGVKGLKGGARRQVGYISRASIGHNQETIDLYKLFFTTSYSTNAVEPPEVIVGDKGDTCTETFLQIGPFGSKAEMMNCKSYMETDFFKVLLYFGKGTMQVTRSVFGLIPLVDFSHPWTDAMLYEKYGLSTDEIAFIESMIRPME